MKKLFIICAAILSLAFANPSIACWGPWDNCIPGTYDIDLQMNVADPLNVTTAYSWNPANEDFAQVLGFTQHIGELIVDGTTADTRGELGGFSKITPVILTANQYEIPSHGEQGEMSTAEFLLTGYTRAYGEGLGVDCFLVSPIRDYAGLTLELHGQLAGAVSVFSDDKISSASAGGNVEVLFNAYDWEYDLGRFGFGPGWDIWDTTAFVRDSMSARAMAEGEAAAFALQTPNFVHAASAVELMGGAVVFGSPSYDRNLDMSGGVAGVANMPGNGFAAYNGAMSVLGAPMYTEIGAVGQATIEKLPSGGVQTHITADFSID